MWIYTTTVLRVFNQNFSKLSFQVLKRAVYLDIGNKGTYLASARLNYLKGI